MGYEEILKVLGSFNLYAWIIAGVGSFLVQKYLKSKGWTIILVGSLFVIVRQIWKVVVSSYGDAGASEVLFNAYMLRYVFGGIGALIISIGLMVLIINYFTTQAKLEEM